jgi:hypothetical protein
MAKIIDKIKKIVKRIKHIDYKKYINTNILFFTTLITSVINALLLRTFTVGNFFELKPLIGDIAMVLILCSFGYLFKPKKQIVYFTTLSIILTAICVINCVYYTFYQSFASISLLATSLQVIEVGNALVKDVIQYKDFTFIWQPIFLLIIHSKLKKRKYYEYAATIEVGKKRFFGTLIASAIVFALFAATLSELELGRLISNGIGNS